MQNVSVVDKSDLPEDFGAKVRGMMLEINDLYDHIDQRYQRGMVSEAKILNMVRHFDWAAFRTILVGQRSDDGDYWVVDGQQRLHAAARCGFKKVPCSVFRSNGWRHEAEVYNLVNAPEHITHLKPWEVFKAVVAYKGEPHYSIHLYLKSLGLKVGGSSGAKAVGIIAFPSRVIDCWKQNEDACQRALRLQYSLFGKDYPMNVNIHKGLHYLLRSGHPVDNAFFSKRLQEGGRSNIIGHISNQRGLSGEAHDRVCAKGIIRILNRGMRSGKIILSD